MRGPKARPRVLECAGKTIAVLRAELGAVERFACSIQAVAYVGLDGEVKQSGKPSGSASPACKASQARPREAAGAFVGFSLWPWCVVSDSKTRHMFAYYHHIVARGLPRWLSCATALVFRGGLAISMAFFQQAGQIMRLQTHK
jgi:Transposase IS116/IS110/IS902 family